jgi:hypothetical protein
MDDVMILEAVLTGVVTVFARVVTAVTLTAVPVVTKNERLHKGTSMSSRLRNFMFGSEITERMSIIFFMVYY